MANPRVALAALLVAVALLSGCASVTRGSKDTLVVESTPSGANVRLSTGQVGKTPTSFRLPRKHDLVVFIEKEGYEPLEINVTSQISGAGGAGMAGNVLVGGLIGAAVDLGTGAMRDLRPNPIQVTLTPLPRPTPASAPVEPATVETPGEALRDVGSPVAAAP